MPTELSNKDLLERCKEFVLLDPTSEAMDTLIKDALVQAEQEIREIDRVGGPLAWLRESYDELFTKPYASISDVTQADPGVITADSSDSDVTGHGFEEDDLVLITGVGGMERLNNRIYRVAYIDSTTFSLKQLHDKLDVDTTNYEEYDGGGTVYHIGLKLPTSTIEPTASLESTASYRWKIGLVFDVLFDLNPALPISEESAWQNPAKWLQAGGRPTKFRHLKYAYGGIGKLSNREHFILFQPAASERYNITIHFSKDYPSISVWDSSTYPPQIPEIHDCIWHRALHILATNIEKAKRSTPNRGSNTRMEVLFAEKWMVQTMKDEQFIINLSRRMLGDGPQTGRGMSA